MKEFYLLRHASTGEIPGSPIFKGRIDSPLTPAGREQAASVAPFFSALSPSAVFTSPLSRARETAGIICEKAGLAPAVERAELNDIDCGKWEGKSVADVMSSEPSAFALWTGDPGKFEMPGGESVAGVQERAFGFITGLLASESDRILIVTHRLVINVTVLAAIGADLRLYWRFGYGTDCGLTRLVHDGKRFTLDLVNSVVRA